MISNTELIILVHGGTVDYKKINKTVTDLEPLIWRIGKCLLVEDKKWLKLFSSIDLKLQKYFKKADSLVVSHLVFIGLNGPIPAL